MWAVAKKRRDNPDDLEGLDETDSGGTTGKKMEKGSGAD